MNLLIDANISPRVVNRLVDAGYVAEHVPGHGMLSATDDAIAAFAPVNGYVIISADSDFASMLALSGHAPSLLLMRSMDKLTPGEQADLLIANLPTVAEALLAGAVASLGNGRLRVRGLPLRSVQPMGTND